MPWKTTNVMEQRIEFIVRALGGGGSFSELCTEYSVSRPTGYRWVKRYVEAGSFAQLQERSRRPHNSPARTPSTQEAEVIELRKCYGWGGKKLHELLKREGIELSVRTINRIINRNGLIKPEDRQQRAYRRFERDNPNDLWQMDFKGEFKMNCGICCYPLSMIDDHSRFALGLFGLSDSGGEGVRGCLIRTFEEYGVPGAMLMDHGSPWWSTTNEYGLTKLSVSLIRQGIKLYHSGVGHPQTQGKVERFHRTVKQSVVHKGKPERFSDWDKVFKEFRYEYNHVRPHEALGMDVPANRYSPSACQYNPNPKEWEYPQGSIVTTVNSGGSINWRSQQYFVSHALYGERVRIQLVDNSVIVSFRHMYIREINTHTGRTTALILPVSET
ncbi:MAG: family transposase [Candidatus Dadabacteria bacterium]|jgi:transposase InsO family protein|nr:family transposase [Candidatus Dadabacteria bacterium]